MLHQALVRKMLCLTFLFSVCFAFCGDVFGQKSYSISDLLHIPKKKRSEASHQIEGGVRGGLGGHHKDNGILALYNAYCFMTDQNSQENGFELFKKAPWLESVLSRTMNLSNKKKIEHVFEYLAGQKKKYHIFISNRTAITTNNTQEHLRLVLARRRLHQNKVSLYFIINTGGPSVAENFVAGVVRWEDDRVITRVKNSLGDDVVVDHHAATAALCDFMMNANEDYDTNNNDEGNVANQAVRFGSTRDVLFKLRLKERLQQREQRIPMGGREEGRVDSFHSGEEVSMVPVEVASPVPHLPVHAPENNGKALKRAFKGLDEKRVKEIFDRYDKDKSTLSKKAINKALYNTRNLLRIKVKKKSRR